MRNLLLAGSLMAVMLVSCTGNTKDSAGGGMGKSASGRNAVKEYPVQALVPQSVTVHQDFPATIEGQRVIEIRPMVNGYLKEIYVNEGDRVKKGQLLFTINNPQYEQDVITEKAQINSALADVSTAKMEIEKVRPLVEKEIVSKFRLQSAELTLQSKEAVLEEARAALSNAQTNLAYTVIKSPQDGIIGTIPYKSGALVGSNSTEALTTLSDISKVFAYFSWNEKQLLELLSGSEETAGNGNIREIPCATLILANKSEYPAKGKIELASGLISTETGAATFKAIFDNPEGLLRSGASAIVRIPETRENVLVVPQEATWELQDKRFVFSVDAKNKVKAVSIVSVPTDDGKYFLVTEGLNPGDRVVTNGVISLKEGDTIRPKEVSATPGSQTDSFNSGRIK